MSKTSTGKQRKLSTNIDENTFQLMYKFAPFMVRSGDIKKATPSAVMRYCVESTMKILVDVEKQLHERAAQDKMNNIQNK